MPRSSSFLTPILKVRHNSKHNWWLYQCKCGNRVVRRVDQIKPDSNCGCYDPRKNTKASLYANTIKNGDCWEWISPFNSGGYGVMRFNRKLWQTHRLSYVLSKGPIPEGMLVCHTCDNRKCINPDHLFLGTYKDNYDDSKQKGRNSRGEAHGNHVLDSDSVLEIRRLRNAGESLNSLARKFMVDKTTIDRAAKGICWNHV
jgi:hypothetical protein